MEHGGPLVNHADTCKQACRLWCQCMLQKPAVKLGASGLPIKMHYQRPQLETGLAYKIVSVILGDPLLALLNHVMRCHAMQRHVVAQVA